MSTAVAYAMSDFIGVRVPEEQGGCGAEHQKETDELGRKVVRCDQCAPLLIANNASYSGTPEGVSATPDERAHEEYMEKKAKTSNAEADAEMRREWMLAKRGQHAEAPSLMDQIRSASAEEKAALREFLGTGDTPAKRSPGRPRKTA